MVLTPVQVIGKGLSDRLPFDLQKRIYTSPQVIEGHLFFDLIHPEDISIIQTQCATMVESKAPFQVFFRYKHSHDGWAHVKAQLDPVFDEYTEVKYLIVVARNISERK